MVRDEIPEELDESLPPVDEGDASEDQDEADPLDQGFDASSDVQPVRDAGELQQPPAANSLESVVGEVPTAEAAPRGMTVGEALSIGMGQVPARLLPDRSAPVAIPSMSSTPAATEPLVVSPPLSSLPAPTLSATNSDGTPEKFYTYYEMRERIESGEAQPSTDPRSIFYGLSASKRGNRRRLHVEVEVTVTNAERIAMIAVEKSKHELKQLLSAHMLEISDKFYAIRQMIRQLSRG